jgi:hypothetical protein
MSNISELEKTNKQLFKQNQKLVYAMNCMKKEIERLSIILKNRAEDNSLAIKILGYFGNCKSIRKTAWKYDCDMIDLFNQILDWDGTYDDLENAEDYLDCVLEVYGRNYYDQKYNKYNDEERAIRSRLPKPNEIAVIFTDYNRGDTSLYNIADKHNLYIDNLFRILKTNGAIEEETDAIGYAEFYTEYVGGNQLWDGITSLGIIE